jgi:hypothetical protein
MEKDAENSSFTNMSGQAEDMSSGVVTMALPAYEWEVYCSLFA